MSTITDGTTTSTPVAVLGYESKRSGQNIVHAVIGRADPDVTLRPAGLRTGTLTLLFESEADAAECEVMHAAAVVLAMADSDVSTVGMSYVVSGAVTRSLDDASRSLWTVAVEYQEVLT